MACFGLKVQPCICTLVTVASPASKKWCSNFHVGGQAADKPRATIESINGGIQATTACGTAAVRSCLVPGIRCYTSSVHPLKRSVYIRVSTSISLPTGGLSATFLLDR